MSFYKPVDPLVENLQQAIDDLRSDITYKKFDNMLQKIYEQFPFVDLSEFLELYVNGEYSKKIIEVFHLAGYTEYYNLLKILKLPNKRNSTQKTEKSKEINLQDKKMEKRYEFLQCILAKFNQSIKDRISHNTLRSIVLLYLYSSMPKFTNTETIIQDIPSTINSFEHLILAPHKPLLKISHEKIATMVNSILHDLREGFFLENNSSGEFRLEKHQLKISDYILNTIRNREGITHQDLMTVIKNKLPILAQMPPSLFQITIHDLISELKIVKKEGYWKLKPSFDEYFTFDYYKNLISENYEIRRKDTKFFGRRILPSEFVRELTELGKGDFEDQDDQVTRIAGMILTNASIMKHPPNEMQEFDFVIDMSNFKFTNEQQKIIQKCNIEIKSNTIYVKVMINDKLIIEELSKMVLKLRQRGQNEQGFIISLASVDKLATEMLQNDKTVQIISEKELKEWCKITPIIPSRRGAVAIVRSDKHKDSIVKIKSVNYESGMADIVFLSDMSERIQYVGALEEITLPVSTEQFIDCSDRYFEFLKKLYLISNEKTFRSVIVNKSLNISRMKEAPAIKIIPATKITCDFYGYTSTEINVENHPNYTTLRYSAYDILSCTCFQWMQQNRTQGLCDHLIFVLNEAVKSLLSSMEKQSCINVEQQLSKIEQRMDLFLNRLRYSNTDGSNAICPHCGKTASTIKQVMDLFGYRQMEKDDKFSLRRQSRCKKCR